MNFGRKTRLSEEIEKGVKYLIAGLTLILIISGGLFIINISTSSQMGYEFRQKELENQELTTQNNQLQLKVLEATSFTELHEEANKSGLTQPDAIHFFESREERLSRN
jgi:cell division protein FtsL